MASGNTLAVFTPLHNEPPTSAFATPDTRNGHPVLDFDASADASAVFSSTLPRHYAGGGLRITLIWAASSATSGDVKWNVGIERGEEAGTDMDADSFAAEQTATGTAPGGSGQYRYTEVAFTAGAEMDSLAVGEAFRLKVTRDADAAADTMTGDAELRAVEIRET
jgi:hypothetical protein